MPDMVNHPPHYISESGLETIDVIESFADAESWNMGNVLKYICRYRKKNGLEDLKKAQWYLNRLISIVEKHNGDSSIDNYITLNKVFCDAMKGDKHE